MESTPPIPTTSTTREEVWQLLRGLVAEMAATNGVDPGDIERDSMLAGDFGFTSVDTIHMVISLEDRLGKDLDMESLVVHEGSYISDLPVGTLCDHICEQLDLPA